MIQTSIDYIGGTAYAGERDDVSNLLDNICCFISSDTWYYGEHGTHLGVFHPESFRSIRGGIFGGIRVINEKYVVTLMLPGQFCRQVEDQKELLEYLYLKEFNFTRLDLAGDDLEKRGGLQTVSRAGEDGNYKYLQAYKLITSKPDRSIDPIPTCYFGNSNKIVRYYDADFLHHNGCNRWELQLRNNSARSAAQEVTTDLGRIGGILFSAIDFGIQKPYRFDRFSWYEEIKQESKEIRLKLPKYQPTFEKSKEWLFSQVSPTLAVAREGLGERRFLELINELTQEGRKSFKNHHIAWIQEIQKEAY